MGRRLAEVDGAGHGDETFDHGLAFVLAGPADGLDGAHGEAHQVDARLRVPAVHVVYHQVHVLHRREVHEVEFLLMAAYLFVVLDDLEVAVVTEDRAEAFCLQLVQDVRRVLTVVGPVDRPQHERDPQFRRVRLSQRRRQVCPVFLREAYPARGCPHGVSGCAPLLSARRVWARRLLSR